MEKNWMLNYDLNWKVVPSNYNQREEIRKTQRSKYSSKKICIYCKKEFDYGYNSKKTCGACKIFIKCIIYGKEFEFIQENYSGTALISIQNAIMNHKNIEACCSKICSSKLTIPKAHEKLKELYQDPEWSAQQKN